MSVPSVKLILCDLGNVLVFFDHRIAVGKIKHLTQKSEEEIYQLFFDSPLTKDFEKGRIEPKEFFLKATAALDIQDVVFEDFVKIWNEIFLENKSMSGVLKELKKKFRLHCITNINALHFRYVEETFPESLASFDQVFCSYVVGARKPDPLFYQRAIETTGLRPEEVLYTDDRVDLIEAAKKLNFQTILFKNTNDFVHELIKRNIFP